MNYPGLVLFVIGLILPSFASAQRPNILLITCDNLGYGDLPCYRPDTSIRSPRLDQLASEGARLTQFYTASPTCTVSRACLLTGRIPQRHGLTEQLGGIAGNYGVGLNQNEQLIPQMLKHAAAPYATGCFGKWNIGFAPGSRPTERGFDEFLGHASGNIDYYHHRYNGQRDLFEQTRPIQRDGQYATDLFADAAIDFIRSKTEAKKSWFCYVPFNAPHFPNARNKLPGQKTEWQAPDWAFEAIGLSPDAADPKRRYDAVMFALDHAIGRVLDAVDQVGATDSTFVFFMSDNGAFRLNREGLDVGINAPLRSGGVTCWEGGLRVPALVRWPGHIPQGIVINEPCWSPDILMACAALSGARLPDGIVHDGMNPLPVFTDGAKSPHKSFYFRYRTHASLRQGDWKIVREKPDQQWQLFDLKTDPAESRNVAEDHSAQVEELQQEFARWEQTF